MSPSPLDEVLSVARRACAHPSTLPLKPRVGPLTESVDRWLATELRGGYVPSIEMTLGAMAVVGAVEWCTACGALWLNGGWVRPAFSQGAGDR